MKRIFINVTLIIIGFIIYFLQSNFFSWFSIAGIKPNLFIIYILFIGLFGNKTMWIVYSFITGIILDLIFKETIGSNLLGLMLIGFIAVIFNKNFSKDSRITIMLMVFGSTMIFEVITYFITYVLYSINLDVLSFIKILMVEIVFNILIVIIIYPLIQRYGYYIENEYKENRILTKYF